MISHTVEYALRAMSHLASIGDGAATSRSIARATRVPHGYLSKVMRSLVCAELVRSFRGPHGGFALARDPRNITLLDIVNAVDPIRRITCCPLDNPLHSRLCSLHRCLDDNLASIEQSFQRTTLGSVLDSAAGATAVPGACRTLFQPAPTTTKE
ncbi:MAG: Rrf2 family transcriptional regulator [Phycisphaeraceae bacterium]|nr:Rrf2 family transcriptional regulator [Phycisphaeraceae bacterium]